MSSAQITCAMLSLLLASSFTGDETNERIVSGRTADEIMNQQARTSKGEHLTADDTISDLLNHPAFAGFGRLLLPWDDRPYDSSLRLRNIGSLLPYHTHVNPAPVVGALNHMIDEVNSGRTVFYDFYTEAESGISRRGHTLACSSFVVNRGRPSRS